ncbi:MAG TPA: Clp protease N-terminal domain-containing protein [Arthrobacter sp.]
MPEQFDDDATTAIVLAKAEARLFGHHHVAPEHLLLALTDNPDTAAARILERLGTSAAAIQADVRAVVAAGARGRGPVLHLTPRAKLAVDLAVRFARRIDNDTTGTEHLLYGVAAEREGLAARVLRAHGVTTGPIEHRITGVIDDALRAAESDAQFLGPAVSAGAEPAS